MRKLSDSSQDTKHVHKVEDFFFQCLTQSMNYGYLFFPAPASTFRRREVLFKIIKIKMFIYIYIYNILSNVYLSAEW